MALKGNLRDFSVTQLLNLINLARKTGTLTLEGPKEAAWVSFRSGKLINAQFGHENGTLTGVLMHAGLITPRQAQTIKRNASETNDKELGLLLINAGYLSQEDILKSIHNNVMQIVYQLFTWEDGSFRFDDGVLPPEDRITVHLNLESIIIEGARRMRENEILKGEIPSLDMALDFANRPGTDIHDINLNAEEWRVVSYVNPKNSIGQIARAINMSDYDIRRNVYSLIQASLVEIVRPDGMPLPPQARKFKPMDKKKQTSLVNRLIQRIRSL